MGRPLTYLCALIVALVASGWFAPAAVAHGGAIAPPPPESGPGGPPKGPVGRPDHVDPGIGGPIVTPGGGFGGPTTPGSRRKPDQTVTFEQSWELWWELNRYALLPRPRPDPRGVVTPDGESGVAWDVRRATLADDQVIPFLLAQVDPETKAGDDVVASSLIALGKIADDEAVSDAMLDWLLDDDAPDIVRESAALGIGLLRRTRPDQQVKAHYADPLRAKLLQVFDRRLGKERLSVPRRTRVFVMYALALLGDQPFDERPLTKDGRLFSKLMWDRVGLHYETRELRLAPILALGLQPEVGLPDAVTDGLGRIVVGEKVQGRKWDAYERAHALTTIVRLGGPTARSRILRVLSDANTHDAVRISAVLAIGGRAESWTKIERLAVVRALERLLENEPGLLLQGLTWIALARLVETDLAEGSTRLMEKSGIRTMLESAATRGPWYARGWAMIALALAARGARELGDAGQAFADRAAVLLVDQLRQSTLHPSARGAAAVALGILGDPERRGPLAAIAGHANGDPELRGHAALALGQLQTVDDDVVAALDQALAARHGDRLRARAALALGLLGRSDASQRLVAGLRQSDSVVHLSSLTVALGHLGDLDAVDALLEVARTGEREIVRAMAIVALGRLLDPEPTPSLLRILLPANYPVRGDALNEALTIL